MVATTQDEFGTTSSAPYARRLEDVIKTKRISWAAVIAGVMVALGIQLVLNMIGAGLGFSAIDPLEGETPSVTTFSIASGLWMLVSSIVALFAGGWLASYLAGLTHDEDGMLHGLVTWALSTLVLVLFLVAIFGSLLFGTLNALGIGATVVAPQAAQSAASAPISEQDIRVFINQLMTEGISKKALVDTVVARTSLSRAEASQAVDEAQETARVAADKTAEAFAHVLLWGALALIAGAMAAGSGGYVGTPSRISRQRAVAVERYAPTV
ncbi:MAG: hypothetical protein ACT4QB_20985 [Gammaproteobacteria bacterium]